MLNIISTCYVKPKFEVAASKQPYHLGPIDVVLVNLEPMHKGLLFATKPKNVQSDLLEKLKISLSIALVHFYPLAGRFVTEKFHDEHACVIYIDCNKGPGASLIHASANIGVNDIVSSVDNNPIVRSFFDLGEKVINYDSHTRPILSVQVTELIDGVFIGFSMNHCIGDGTSLWHFIMSLSEIYNQILLDDNFEDTHVTISRKPIYKPYFPEGYGPFVKLPYLEPNEFVQRFDPRPIRERIFHFSPKAISMLKAKANEECGVQNISSFQALCAFLWRAITRARNLEPHIETSCLMFINFRAKLDPALSQNHFGNHILDVPSGCKAGELLANGLGWVAMLIHQCVAATNDNFVQDYFKKFMEATGVARTSGATAYHKSTNILVAGSAKFDMYAPEFGLGRAIAVLAGSNSKDDGKLTANPGCQGEGSVDLEVCLNPETMNALELDEEFVSVLSH